MFLFFNFSANFFKACSFGTAKEIMEFDSSFHFLNSVECSYAKSAIACAD
jgi:hypothetical protein